AGGALVGWGTWRSRIARRTRRAVAAADHTQRQGSGCQQACNAHGSLARNELEPGVTVVRMHEAANLVHAETKRGSNVRDRARGGITPLHHTASCRPGTERIAHCARLSPCTGAT